MIEYHDGIREAGYVKLRQKQTKIENTDDCFSRTEATTHDTVGSVMILLSYYTKNSGIFSYSGLLQTDNRALVG